MNKEKLYVAIHEAGHAVMAEIVEIPTTGLTLHNGGGGKVSHQQVPHNHKTAVSRLLIAIAGRAAECVFHEMSCGIPVPDIDWLCENDPEKSDPESDLVWVKSYAGDDLPKLWDIALDTVIDAWEIIQRVATEALKLETLTGDQIREIIRLYDGATRRKPAPRRRNRNTRGNSND